MRAFIAIKIPAQTCDIICRIQEQLKTSLPKVSWVKPENLHLTLKFLGEVSSKQIDRAKEITAEIAESCVDFKIRLEALGVFPNLHRGRIIWLGSDQLPEELVKIVEKVEEKIAELGKPKEERPFLAHITIGRIKSPINPTLLEEEVNKINNEICNKNLEFNAAGITLFKSILSRQGPTYISLKEDSFKIA